jgi:hypothetical protein
MRTNKWFCVSCIIACFYSAQAQQSEEVKEVSRFLEIGVSANAYRGDLSTQHPKWSSAFHAGLKLNFKKRLNSHLNLAIGTIMGQNPDYVFVSEMNPAPSPNLFFKTNFISANYDLQLNLLKYKGFIVYLSQGIGLIRYEPKDDTNETLQNKFDTRAANETYGNVSLMLPTQAGINYILKNGYGIGLQAGWLNPQTDYIDNISQWGNRQKKDNTFMVRFAFMIPLTYK